MSGNPETIAYIVGVLSKRRWDSDDLSNQSVVLTFQDACLKGDFVTFQRIGDYVLFIDTAYPEHFNGIRECVENVGRLSYQRCFRLMGGKWRVFEELADELPSLVSKVRRRLV